MLATSPAYIHRGAPHSFLPTVPSPLSPRSANVYGGRRSEGFMSSPGPFEHRKPHASFGGGNENDENGNVGRRATRDDASVPFAKRAVKKAPSPKQDELKERRRSLFLRKVRDGREDKRFEARGEDMMRLDFVQRQRQWEAERARDAPWLLAHVPEEEDDREDEYDLPTSSNVMHFSAPASQVPTGVEEVEEVLQMEDRELEALLSYMPSAEAEDDRMDGGEEELHSDHLWSDDDYDALFEEFMGQGGEGQKNGEGAQPQDEEMDLS